MRLICPNCQAHYEVSDEAIPAEGRDVQCSNCGHGWFFVPPEPDPVEADPLPEAAAPALPPSRSLDRNLLAILHEEAEREAQARSREADLAGGDGRAAVPEADSVPSGSGLGPAPGGAGASVLERASDPASSAADDVPAAGEAADTPARTPRLEPRRAARAAGGGGAARSPDGEAGRLPDVDRITSTLGDPTSRPSRGFAAGVALMLMLAAGLAGLYAGAPRLAQAMPEAEPALRAYVGAADRARLALDRLVDRAAEAMAASQG